MLKAKSYKLQSAIAQDAKAPTPVSAASRPAAAHALCGMLAWSSRGWPRVSRFYVSRNHARNARVPRAPVRSKLTASPTGEWEGPTRRVTGHIHAHSSRCHAPQGQEGPNTAAIRIKTHALCKAASKLAAPVRASRGVRATARSYRHARRSLVARMRRSEHTGSTRSRLRLPAPSRGKACGVYT